ncbi:MAG: hypothetical protein ACI9BD_001507, partial [Candidatus Marinamargulisbacteria bacterium]
MTGVVNRSNSRLLAFLFSAYQKSYIIVFLLAPVFLTIQFYTELNLLPVIAYFMFLGLIISGNFFLNRNRKDDLFLMVFV